MREFWLVVKNEYVKRVGKRSFFISTLGIPLLVIILLSFTAILAGGSQTEKPVGYIDQAGFLASGEALRIDRDSSTVVLRKYPDETSARASLEKGEIQAYYVLPEDYLQTRRVSLYYWYDAPTEAARREFDAFLRANLVAGQSEEVKQRLLAGSDLRIRSRDGQRELSGAGILNLVIPFMAGFLFVFSVMLSAGFLMKIVADEKENRTMEVMITSILPEQFIGGKAIGLMGVALTQMLIWVAILVLGLVSGAHFVEALQLVQIPWSFLLVVALFFFPAYALMAGLMTAIGASVTDVRHGQQIVGFLNVFFMLPYFFLALIFVNPDSPILVALTLFPTTAFVTVTLRWSMTAIPFWQLLSSWTLLVFAAGGSIWVSAKVFRAGMLQYGQELSLRSVYAAVRAR